ncbi:hypothetical protein GGF46_002945 [Coemansia sp. RSA 552]|nr:hypothetical protein GGF46_002945 [Coemansia sp. RSA 552]
MTRPLRDSPEAVPAIADSIDRYFSAVLAQTSAGTGAKTAVARQILQSCRVLVSGLGQVRLGARHGSALDLCRPESQALSGAVDCMRQAHLAAAGAGPGESTTCPLHGYAGPRCLDCAGQQTVRSLRQYIVALSSSPEASSAGEESLQALTAVLHAAAVEVSHIHTQLNGTGELQPPTTRHDDAEPGAGDSTSDPNPQKSEWVREALASTAALAELLRTFVRVSRPPARPRLAHVPSVPSPLSGGANSARHRRWVSEEIEGEPSASPLQAVGAIDGATGSSEAAHGVSTLHMRNRSESRVHSSGSPAISSPRKSALSLGRPQPPIPGTAEAGERSKQVRFLESAAAPSLSEPAIDQARLDELEQLLPQLEAAVAVLEAAAREQSASTCTQEIRRLATAFVQVSRLSSTSGLVRHYDKAALAHFKATTQAVKRLMAKDHAR